jgi:hypothetical protein
MPRRPMIDKGAQTSLRLPSDLHQKLLDAAGDRGIGDEIRRRLEMSFSEPDPLGNADPETHRLLSALAWISAAVADAYGASWRTDPYAAGIFREAMRDLMGWATAQGEAPPTAPKPGSVIDRLLQKNADMAIGANLGFSAAAREDFI